MKAIEFEVYKREDGRFSREQEVMVVTPSIRDYLMSTMNDEEKREFSSRSGRQTKNRRYRAGQSEGYRRFCDVNKVVVNSCLYGKVTAEYDGRLKEGSVIVAILHALKNGSTTMKVEPANNSEKPAHLRMVYIKDFSIQVYHEN